MTIALAHPPRSADPVPRDFNFAADLIEKNLRAGRSGKCAYIDPRGSWTYAVLADRVARFGNALRSLGIHREERILLCLQDTVDFPTAMTKTLDDPASRDNRKGGAFTRSDSASC
jgi:benzoate-CoA ligase